MYYRAMGRVGRLLACGHPDGVLLKERLNVVKRSYQQPLLERYQQAIANVIDGALHPVQATEQIGIPPWE